MRSQAAFLVAFAALLGSASAFWRMPCRSQTGHGRIDPIVDPGIISAHVHTTHGGGGFGLDATYETLTQSNCTSCEVTQDQSAYWTPALYFMFDNGSSVMVNQDGGMLAYYLFGEGYNANVTAFPEGFVMVAGNSALRNFSGPFPDIPLSYWPQNATDQFWLSQRALGFNCLNYDVTPEPSLYRHEFPTKEYMDANCTDGLRLELAFPSCGTGAIDSPDHKSHMAYPNLVKAGNCPPGYDVHYPFLFYETIWETNAFANISGQFVLSMGDPTGTGYHGDFLMGWESQEFLQSAVNTCTSLTGEIQDCPVFDIQTDEVAAQCTYPVPDCLADDDVFGPRNGLPVNVPIQYGPANATAYAVAGQSGVSTTSMAYSVPTSVNTLPDLPYTAANANLTSTALGGIVVDQATFVHYSQSTGVAGSIPQSALSSFITASASLESGPSSSVDIVATSLYTQGNEVIELEIQEIDVTVTVTPTAGAKYKRHIYQHIYRHDIHR